MPESPLIRGVDISRWNPDYTTIEPGIDFVIIKATDGLKLYNTLFAQQVAMTRASGAVCAYYHWLTSTDPIEAQAQYFVDTVQPRPDEFLACDWEEQIDGTRQPTDAERLQFLAAVKRLTPRHKVGTYCNRSEWGRSNKDPGDFLWIADPGVDSPRIEEPWLIHQYTFDPRDYNRAQFPTRAAMRAWATAEEEPVPAQTERIAFRGGLTCACVVAIIPVVEGRLKAAGIIKNSVDFFQLGYRDDVEQSAGTHAGGGAMDVKQYSTAALKIWRECGVAMWHRTPAQKFIHHGHGIVIGCPHASSGAKDQVDDYRAGRNGLANDGRDDGPDVPYITWKQAMTKYSDTPTPTTPPPSGGGGGGATDEIEELMTDWKRFSTEKDQKLAKAGKWQYLKINDGADVSFATGPCRVTATIAIRAAIPVGQSIYVQVVEDDIDSKGKVVRRVTYPAQHEIAGTNGDTFAVIPWAGVTGKPKAGGAVRVRVVWHSWDKTAVIKRAEVGRFSSEG